ncbi:MAG: hypothetical protein Q9170_003444 [Blastenia crenularia]
MGLFDDVFDDLCPTSLRIPPLQDPFPFPTITDRRLSPLEPNARTNSNIDKETAKLTGRGKALAEAKPIGDSEENELRPIHSTPRKRKKYDVKPIPEFVQLPKPKAKAKDNKPAPFLVLNQLNEPPPSAALFPPITPNATVVEHDSRPSTDSISEPPTEKCQEIQKGGPAAKDNNSSGKRLYLKKRTKWSEEETYSLVRGIDRFGVGKWTRILNDPEYTFLQGRSPIDLKDRLGSDRIRLRSFRTLMGNAPIQPARGVSYQELLGYADGVRNPESEPCAQNEEIRQPRKKPKHLWSEEEDESLVEGYQKHGFCWKDIANDSSLALGNRSGPQIRDRFRKRFPELYGEASAPAPRKDPPDVSNAGQSAAALPGSKGQHSSSGNQRVNRKKESEEHNNDSLPTRRLSATLPRQVSSASAPHGINGLLNNEGDNHQSSFRSDDWEGNVTLPPLLWEDLCTKPMFELD